MPLKDLLILTAPPGRLARVRELGLTPGHLCYRIGRGGHLFRANNAVPPRGGLMAADARGFDGQGNMAALCQEFLRECAARGFSGILCLFGPQPAPALARLAGLLDEAAARRELALYVPEACGPHTRRARVMISSALSGGSLRLRLEESALRFGGPERLALAVEPVSEQFLLPSPSGSGRALSREELDSCLRERAPSVFFSAELCARYFTYMSGDGGARFVLYDDAGTVSQKLLLARELGIPRAVAALEDLDGMLEELAAMTQ